LSSAKTLGRLVSVGNTNSTTTIDTYDELGRVTGGRQATGTQSAYIFGYTYNLAGLLTQGTYPSVCTVQYSYDTGDRSSTVSDTAPGSTVTFPHAGTTAAPINYAPHGPLTSMNRGDGLVEA